jgi:glycosyltransferase involved in cell wall biosynthesis
MKKIYFHYGGGKYHSLFNSILENPPEGYKIFYKKNKYKSISNIQYQTFRSQLKYLNFFPIMYLVEEFKLFMSHIYEKDLTDFDLVLSAHRIMNLKKVPWIVMIEYVGDLCPKIYDINNIRFYKSYIEKSLMSDSCKSIIPYLNEEKKTLFRYLDCSKFKEKIKVVHLSVFPKKFIKKYDKETILLLFLGSSNNINSHFRARGGIEVLEAFREIDKKYSNIELILRAKLPIEILKKYSKLLSKPNIKIIDRLLPIKKFNNLMENSDILLFPGYITPAMTFIESMSYEIPIIATNWRGNKEIIEDKETGYLIKSPYGLDPNLPLNMKEIISLSSKGPDYIVIQELIEKMSILIEEKKIRKRMGRKARSEIEIGKFSMKTRNKKLNEIFKKALS